MEKYQGRLCGCAPGTHALLEEMIRRHVAPCAGVLDIGAHSGALLLRLEAGGFTDLVGTDLDPTRFDCPGAKFQRMELNRAFSADFDRKFRLITCADVIEHLDSPRNLIQEARLLLEEDGFLAISLPNVAYWEGRCKFVLKGELWGFGQGNYRVQRHISPVTFEQMEMMMQELGFAVVAAESGGSFATPLRQALTLPLWGPLRVIGGRRVLGESAVFLAKKAPPLAELKSPVHYRDRWQGTPDRIGLEDAK